MESALYEQMAELQAEHWWFEAKRMVVRRLLDRFGATGSEGHRPVGDGDARAPVLDVGCGTGSMVPVLRLAGRVVGVDAYLPALRYVNGAAPVGGNLLSLPFADRTFGVVGCFDVLYHRAVADVPVALAEMRRVCRPGGLVVITDSACPALMSAHDVAFHGARRFGLTDLSARVAEAGFSVLHGSYYHTMLFPAAAARRLASRARRAGLSGRSDLERAPRWLNQSLIRLYQVESTLAARYRLPFGLSLVVVARRDPAPE
ncbi:MAG TPA: class I SAM-dependent methyltransferase [Vicinamibacterales bacterium]|nr:class I SAM-dependent methyltransferase [Vicinamibacterales bacterium]